MVVQEHPFFTDDAAVVAKMLENEWSLGPENQPNITYIPQSYMMNARTGSIFVYVTSASNRPATTDYRTVERTVHVSVKVDNRFREDHFAWCDEVYRILLANRRLGRRHDIGYSELDVDSHRTLQNESGWYTSIFDLTLTAHHMSIHSAGFGDRINNQVDIDNHNIHEGKST